MLNIENETKQDKFVRLAEKRTLDIIKRVRLLSNLSSTKNYEYSSKQVNKILSSIDLEVQELKRSFKKEDSKRSVTFNL